MRTHLTSGQRAELDGRIVRMREQGVPTPAVCKRLGVTRAYANAVMRKRAREVRRDGREVL